MRSPILSRHDGRSVHKRLNRKGIEEDKHVSPFDPPASPQDFNPCREKESLVRHDANTRRLTVGHTPISQANIRVYSLTARLHLVEPMVPVQERKKILVTNAVVDIKPRVTFTLVVTN